MITAFSFRANGWVNFKVPNVPTPAIIERGRALAFYAMDATLDRERDAYVPFAYATKHAAERFNIDQPAIPREWAKVIPTWGAGE